MTKPWIHQHELYGLGNFINLTPTIKLLAEHLGHPISVYFDLDFIKQCYLYCPFIEILDERPSDPPAFSSGLINVRNNCPDYLHVYREVTKRFPLDGELPHTYVDSAPEIEAPKYNTLFIRGSGSEQRALIREADYIVANDSGLAHAAAAMQKPMTILWKNTSLPKNSNPNTNCRIRMCNT